MGIGCMRCAGPLRPVCFLRQAEALPIMMGEKNKPIEIKMNLRENSLFFQVFLKNPER
jgi:hypothetical protein